MKGEINLKVFVISMFMILLLPITLVIKFAILIKNVTLDTITYAYESANELYELIDHGKTNDM